MFIAGTPMELYASVPKSELERLLEGEALDTQIDFFSPAGDYLGKRHMTLTPERRLGMRRDYHRNRLDKAKLSTVREQGQERYVLVMPHHLLGGLYETGRGDFEATSIEVHINRAPPKEWAIKEKEARRPYGPRAA